MLEKMNEFFDNRIDGYDEHMMTCIESAEEFYPYTAECLPVGNNVNVLDLGCGTGLELEYYFKINPTASITGIDLTESMLNTLKKKFTDKNLNLVLGSYFDLPFGIEIYDAAVSVESLHHFTKEEKIPLYAKLHKALKNGGYFILTDYFASSDEDEQMYRKELLQLKKLQGIEDNEFYHYDTPLTVEHEKEAFIKAGFSSVDVLGNWGNTYTIRANK